MYMLYYKHNLHLLSNLPTASYILDTTKKEQKRDVATNLFPIESINPLTPFLNLSN